MSQSLVEALDSILKLIYGPNVVENAYASPAGRLTLAEARTRLTAYAATVEREARIDEMLHTTYLLGQGYYRCNHLPDGDTEFIPQADRLATLQGPREEPDGE